MVPFGESEVEKLVAICNRDPNKLKQCVLQLKQCVLQFKVRWKGSHCLSLFGSL